MMPAYFYVNPLCLEVPCEWKDSLLFIPIAGVLAIAVYFQRLRQLIQLQIALTAVWSDPFLAL